MIKFVVQVQFRWWKNGKRVPDRYGTVIGTNGGEYLISPNDDPKHPVQLYFDEFKVIGLKKE